MREKELTQRKKEDKDICEDIMSKLSFSGSSERFAVTSFQADTFRADTVVNDGLFSYVLSYVKRGAGNAFKFNVKDWITVGVIILVWVVTGIFKSLNMDNPILKLFAFFTSAYNGLNAGVLPITGGVAAKSFLFAATAGTLIPFFENLFKGKIRSELSGFSSFTRQFTKINLKNIAQLAMILIGMGAAFVLYGFLSVNGSFQNNFISIMAVFLIIKNFGSKNSFLTGFLSRALRKTVLSGNGVNAIIIGIVIGYSLSVPVSLLLSQINKIGYILGGIAIIAGAIMLFVSTYKSKEGSKI